MVGRYTHAHKFKRAWRQLKFLRTRLGQIIRDVRRKIDGDAVLEARFGPLLDLTQRLQDRHQRVPKSMRYMPRRSSALAKAKPARLTSSVAKVSIAISMTFPKRGQLVLHAKALHDNPFDGHTLGLVIVDMEKLTGVKARRIYVDKGYRGHKHPDRLRVWVSGQVRRVTASIRREIEHSAAVEPVIGHVKAEHRMGRNTSRAASATTSTSSSQQPATSSVCYCDGSQHSCVPLSGRSPKLSPLKRRLNHRSSASSRNESLFRLNIRFSRSVTMLKAYVMYDHGYGSYEADYCETITARLVNVGASSYVPYAVYASITGAICQSNDARDGMIRIATQLDIS